MAKPNTLTEKVQSLLDFDIRDQLSHWELSFVTKMGDFEEEREFSLLQEEKVDEIYDRYCT